MIQAQLDTAIDRDWIRNAVLADAFDADIDLGYGEIVGDGLVTGAMGAGACCSYFVWGACYFHDC